MAFVDGLFEEAGASGALKEAPIRERTVLFWSALQGVMQLDKLSYLSASDFDPRSLVPELARALLLGWGANKDRLARAQKILEDMSV